MKRLRSGFIIIALLLAWTSWGQEKGAKTRVAIYKDTGTTTKGPVNIEKCLQDQPDFSYAFVKAEDIRGGALAHYDVVVLPGGGAAAASKALGEEGRQAIVNFVKAGGGYLGDFLQRLPLQNCQAIWVFLYRFGSDPHRIRF